MEDRQQNLENFITEHSWLIRPCVLYEEEFNDCKSIRSRFHQHFLNGSFVDCSQWKRDYDNCVRCRDDGNQNSCKELIDIETLRRNERLKAHRENDIWEKRTTPPSTWNDPLPKHMEEKLKYSYLSVKAKEVNEPVERTSLCSIM